MKALVGKSSSHSSRVCCPHLPSAHVRASLFLTYELRDLLGHLLQINFGEISESDDCQFFFNVPRQDRFETLK